ncbi:MAG: muconolactone Delta-isomerase family protein [Myxococcales bacterium]
MRFLVQMELVELESHRSSRAIRPMVPTLHACARLERQGRIVAGGLCAGARRLTFIAEAASSDELDELLDDMPASNQMRIGVTALDPFGADQPARAPPRSRRRRPAEGSEAPVRSPGSPKRRRGGSSAPKGERARPR